MPLSATPDRDQQDHAHAQRCHHQRGDQYAGGKLGQDDGAQDADPLGKEAAHELARGAAHEHQGKAEADARNARALGDEQEREEGEKAGAAGAVDELDGAEQRKARRIGEAPSRRRGLRAGGVRARAAHAAGAREQHQREDADAGDDRPIEHDAAAPADGDDAETDGCRDRHLADVADEIVDAERGPPRRGHVGARDQRRGDRVLHGRADARQQDQAADGRVALGRRQQGKCERPRGACPRPAAPARPPAPPACPPAAAGTPAPSSRPCAGCRPAHRRGRRPGPRWRAARKGRRRCRRARSGRRRWRTVCGAPTGPRPAIPPHDAR